MANEVSKIKLPNDTTEYPLQDDQAIASITRSGTTFTATRRDGTSFTFTQQDNNTTYTFATGDNNGQIKVTPSGGTAQNVSVKGLGAAAYKGTTTSVTSGSSDLVTSGAVYTAIDNLPSPMVFKGTLGTNGTITTLPTASSANEGFVYKCITAGTYASQEAKVGDVFISNTTEWVLIPAGDTDTDTWRNIKVDGTQKLGNGISTGAVDFISGNHVSLSFNATGNKLTVAHSDTSSQASVTNSGRTYIQSIGLDGDGHVTSLTSATETVVNTDRYVNSVAFANDTSGVKMTLTRAGSDTATVTGTIPLVSSSTAGVAPKGAAVSSQSQSTKFLREDGSWATPSYTTNTNTTYTIGTSGNNITLTPSSGSVQSITAPYATDAGYLRDSVTATAKLRYINSTDVTTWTADTLAATDSIAIMRGSVTDAPATSHAIWFNVKTIGTKCQYYLPDNGNYIYKRWYNNSNSAWNAWTKMSAGYADSAGSATKATQDGSGNTITSTYVKKSGDTITGELKIYREGTTTQNVGAYLTFQNKDTTTGKTSNGYIIGYNGGENGLNMVLTPGGNMFIGSGEAAQNHYNLYTHNTGENFYATADTHMYLQANGQTIANRVGMVITNGHTIVPCKADVTANNTGSIGTESTRWGGMYTTKLNKLITGSGTAAQDKGSGVSPRYFPAKWTFNTGANATDGDAFTIKIPVAGHGYGVYMSVNNGSNYYPIVLNGTGRLTTHYPVNTYITVVFESSGSATSIYPVGGGDATTTVTGGAWRVVNYYDSNSTVNQTATTTDANYEVLFSGTADNTTRNEGARKSNALIFNPVAGLKIGVSSQSTFPVVGIQVHDVRSVNFTPDALAHGANFFFSNNTMPNGNWWAGLHVKGWNGAYAAWEIVGSAHNNDSRTTPLYVRSSNQASTWGSWRKIYDTSNPPSKSDVGLGNVENKSSATIRGELTSANVTDALGYTPPTSDTNTHRPIQMNGTEILGNNTTVLNLKAGSNVSLSHSSGTVTIAATNTNTHRPIQVDGTEVLGNNTTALNLVAGTNVSLSNDGGAVTITATDTNNAVAITNTNPTTGTWYYPVWHSSTSATSTGLKANDGFLYYSIQGTASAVGRSILRLGNGTQTGTAGNKYGDLRIYSQKQGYSTLTMASGATAERKHTLPDVAGTIGVFTATPTSGQVVVSDGTAGGFKTTGYTIAKSVPSNAVFTDANVTQTKTTTDANYDILFSVSTSGTDTKTEGARKSDKIKFNPSDQILTIGSGNNESIISNVDIKTKQYELRSPDKTLSVKMKLDNDGQTAILAEDSEGTMLWYNNYINSDGTLQWNNPITCSEAFSCASFLSGQIELKQASPYIDFHHNNSTADFTSRIITTNLAELTFYGKNSSGTTVYGTCRGAAFTVVSSKYMKENIKDIEDDEAKKLLQLRPVSFDYKYTGETNKRGLIAEEVLDVMPEMVYVPENYSEPMDDTIPDNVPSIDYSKFVPYLIKMIQIQQKEIDELKFKAKD